MGKKAAPTPAATEPSGPKVTMLDASQTAAKAVRKKRAPMTAGDPTILGADTLGGGAINAARAAASRAVF